MGILNDDVSRLTVQLKEHRPAAFCIGIGHSQQADDKPLTGINFDRKLLANFGTEKEHGCRQQ